GSITVDQKRRLFRILGLRSRVMNPSSRGASQVAYATAAVLSCFGIDTPGTGQVKPGAPPRSTEPLLLAHWYARHQVSLYGYHLKFIGNQDGRFAPMIALGDGSTVIVGTRSDL